MEIQTKFKIKDTVYLIYQNEIKPQIITEININIRGVNIDIKYGLDGISSHGDMINEKNLYSTKEEVLKTL